MALVINAVTFDKNFYHAGDLVTMTVTYTPDLFTGVTVNVKGTDQFNNSTSSAPGEFVTPNFSPRTGSPDPIAWTVTDDASDTWAGPTGNPVSVGSGQFTVQFTTTAP